MFKEKEILVLILALIVLSFSYSFTNAQKFLHGLIYFSIVLFVYVIGKKLTAYYYEVQEEEKIWTFQRYGLYERSYFKKPIPIGIVLPFLVSVLSYGKLFWLAVIESEIEPRPERAAKRHDYYSFSEITEYHLAMISASGIFFCLLLSLFAYIINFEELAKLSLYFASFNLLPIGRLDGSRIFFGSRVLYATLVIITLIVLGYSLLLV